MDEVNHAVQTIKPDSKKQYESFVIEQNVDSLKIEVKTSTQYFQEQLNKQKKTKQIGEEKLL